MTHLDWVFIIHYCPYSVSLQNEIDRDEAEKQKLEAEVAAARERLEVVDNRLSLKTARMENYDKAIAKSEAAYLQILESSQVIKVRPIRILQPNHTSSILSGSFIGGEEGDEGTH